MYHTFDKLTNFKYWQRKPLSKAAMKTYNKVFEAMTGIKPSNNLEYYPMCSISKSNIKHLMEYGYLPDEDIGDMKLVGLGIPMWGLHTYIGGFMVAYKPPKTKGIYKWITYTLIEEYRKGPEKPIITFGRGPGHYHGYLVDKLEDYLKLANWLFDKKYKSTVNPPMILMTFKGDWIIQKFKMLQYCFDTVTDFTGNYYYQLADIVKGNVIPNVKSIEYFNIPNYHCNVLQYCTTRLQFEDALRLLSKTSVNLFDHHPLDKMSRRLVNSNFKKESQI